VPQGNYNLSFGGAAAGKVDPDGNAPAPQTVSVVAGSTNTVNYLFDSPGRIQNVAFTTRNYANQLRAMTWDSMVVDQTGMTTARTFTSTSGRVLNMSTPMTMFPFTSPYAVYAGTCGDNNPTGGNGLGSALVPVGGTVTGPTIQLPSLQVTVYTGNNTSSPRAVNADVTATDRNCGVTRSLTPGTSSALNTNSNGQIPDDTSVTPNRPMIGLPYSDDYEICANNAAGSDERKVSTSLTSSGANGTTLNIFLGGAPSGTCP
jgi:hypothetical protein